MLAPVIIIMLDIWPLHDLALYTLVLLHSGYVYLQVYISLLGGLIFSILVYVLYVVTVVSSTLSFLQATLFGGGGELRCASTYSFSSLLHRSNLTKYVYHYFHS